jgi:tetratricopeptide (TPR) repeat protein
MGRDAWAINKRGEVYLRINQTEKALEDFNQRITLTPEAEWPYYLRALTHLKLNHPEPAKTDLQTAISIATTTYEKDPLNYRNTFNLALYHLTAAHHEESDRLYSSHLTAPIKWLQMAILVPRGYANDDLNDLFQFFPDRPQAQQVKQQLQGAISATQPTTL